MTFPAGATPADTCVLKQMGADAVLDGEPPAEPVQASPGTAQRGGPCGLVSTQVALDQRRVDRGPLSAQPGEGHHRNGQPTRQVDECQEARRVQRDALGRA